MLRYKKCKVNMHKLDHIPPAKNKSQWRKKWKVQAELALTRSYWYFSRKMNKKTGQKIEIKLSARWTCTHHCLLIIQPNYAQKKQVRNRKIIKCKLNLHAPQSVEYFSHMIEKNPKLVHKEYAKCKLNLHSHMPVDISAEKWTKSQVRK
jgi:hypothetical protein